MILDLFLILQYYKSLKIFAQYLIAEKSEILDQFVKSVKIVYIVWFARVDVSVLVNMGKIYHL